MGCTITGYKSFLVCCNVVLLFVGTTVFILGIKMQGAMSMLLLINIPIVMKAVKAIIAAGFFISLTGISGICGACYELKWLLTAHLILLEAIVIMEFSLGVALMLVKKEVEKAVKSSECNGMCAANLDAIILDYALPSAGIMVAIIFVEALMIYSAGRLYFYIRDKGKTTSTTPVREQDVQMEDVTPPPPAYVAPPTYVAASCAVPQSNYVPPPPPQPVYVAAPQPIFVPPPPQPAYEAAPQRIYMPQLNIYNTNQNTRK